MTRLFSRPKFFAVCAAVGLVLVLGSIFGASHHAPLRLALLGFGLALVTLGLIGLQMAFFAEGDKKKPAVIEAEKSPPITYPASLKHPTYRAIWKNVTLSGDLIEQKNQKSELDTLGKEKKWLGLPSEENILFKGEHHRPWTIPAAIVSLACITTSSIVPDSRSTALGFTLLFFGLFGALIAFTGRRESRFYLTNFRVLVGRRPIMGKVPSWKHLHYGDIHHIHEDTNSILSTVNISGENEKIVLQGLKKKKSAKIRKIIEIQMQSQGMSLLGTREKITTVP